MPHLMVEVITYILRFKLIHFSKRGPSQQLIAHQRHNEFASLTLKDKVSLEWSIVALYSVARIGYLALFGWAVWMAMSPDWFG